VKAAELEARLSTRWLGRAFEWHAECDSTNDLAAERARAGAPSGLVVAADAQTRGRGRLGRTWHSPAEDNLYVSILLRPTRPPAEIPPLTLLVGGAVAEALAKLGLAPRLKWPNDVQLIDQPREPSEGSHTLPRQTPPSAGSPGGSARLGWHEARLRPRDDVGRLRKVAGVLTEMATVGPNALHVVVGLGLNVNGLEFPPELADRATSLRRALGRKVDRLDLLAALLDALEPLYDDFEQRGPAAAVAAFQAYAAFPARCRVTAPGQPGDRLEGVALGVDADGALRLRDDTGQIHRVISGELS
jgi:BirA family transcriptional regulator, biotin operon repressor / biotin---[acetyl-CoA-carboxylase] ligase